MIRPAHEKYLALASLPYASARNHRDPGQTTWATDNGSGGQPTGSPASISRSMVERKAER